MLHRAASGAAAAPMLLQQRHCHPSSVAATAPPRARRRGVAAIGPPRAASGDAPTYTSAADLLSRPGAGAHVLDPVWDVLAKVDSGGGATSRRTTASSSPSSGGAGRPSSSSSAPAPPPPPSASPIARKTKIVCTIGPATCSREDFFALADAGMDCVRLNMSHGTHASHGAVIELAKEYNARVRAGKGGRSVLGLLLDTRGPEVRSGDLQEPLTLNPGDPLTFTRDPSANGREGRVGVNYSDFCDDVAVGDELLVDGGIITFRVDSKDAESGDVRCTTVDGGVLGSRRHLNVRGRSANLPALTERDMEDLKFGLEMGVDYYALSFVRDAQVLRDVKAWLAKQAAAGVGGVQGGGAAPRVRVLAKVESADSVKNLDAVLDAADGAMVARGDLGAELPVADVPHWQNAIIDGCRRRGKVCITATNMLESMIEERPVPTRAEVSDIAIAVREGSDAVMLSGETAYGRYPLRAVATMGAVAAVTEGAMARYSGARRFGTDEASPIDWLGAPPAGSSAGGGAALRSPSSPSPSSSSPSFARRSSSSAGSRRGGGGGGGGSGAGGGPTTASSSALSELMAYHSVTIGDTAGVPILVFSRTGGMPALLSHYRPHHPIFCVTDSPDVQQRLSLFHGVVALYMPSLGELPSVDDAIDAALSELLSRGLLRPREHVAIVQSGRRPIWRAPSTHVIQLRRAERRHARAARELRLARRLDAGAANIEAAAAAAAAAADEARARGRGAAAGVKKGSNGGSALSSFGVGAASSLNLDDDSDEDEDGYFDDEDWDDEDWDGDADDGSGAGGGGGKGGRGRGF